MRVSMIFAGRINFAYAFAFTGAALVTFLEGSGHLSLDHRVRGKKGNPVSGNTINAAPANYIQEKFGSSTGSAN